MNGESTKISIGELDLRRVDDRPDRPSLRAAAMRPNARRIEPNDARPSFVTRVGFLGGSWGEVAEEPTFVGRGGRSGDPDPDAYLASRRSGQ
jgi:hypothetical protein